MSEVITKVLYPADDHIEGKTLRLKQQYFFLSATAQSIIKTHMRRFNDIRSFFKAPRDTDKRYAPGARHPELMRIMMDEYGLGWDEAWQQVSESVAYTNHTVMSEALEKWPQDLVQTLLPRVWEILCEINRRWCEYLVSKFGSSEKVGKNLIIRDGQVHMVKPLPCGLL